MYSVYLGLGALALSSVNAWTYPDCEMDNCYRNLIDARFTLEAGPFCLDFISGTTTAAAAIPTDFNNCAGDIAAVSSACSCIAYTLTHESSPTKTPCTTSTTPIETPTSTPCTTTTPPPKTHTSTPCTTSTTPGRNPHQHSMYNIYRSAKNPH
ncbi:hypothetical protein LARI1_G006251 [Lachnellula arida]|uniref:Uncharacterized protein n=1 Tax=Lachnellula arida TaxID=1316785 RepID=A0A8T9B6E6_9HELO|nr:hypothetical protein LARI1_G006251 [Lachnellula arida]